MASLVSSWDSLDVSKGKLLENGASGDYLLFDGITLANATGVAKGTNVTIGIYQANGSVYAFASTTAGKAKETTTITDLVDVNEDGVFEETSMTAKLIASGTGTVGDGNKISDMVISLSNGSVDLNKIGYSDDVVSYIFGSDNADAIYIVKKTGGGASDANITLTGGKGDDSYYLGGMSGAIVSDFGFVNSSGSAKTDSLGADIVYVDNLDSSLSNIKYSSGNVRIGDKIILKNSGANTDGEVYVQLATGTGADSVKTYKVAQNGATVAGGTGDLSDSGVFVGSWTSLDKSKGLKLTKNSDDEYFIFEGISYGNLDNITTPNANIGLYKSADGAVYAFASTGNSSVPSSVTFTDNSVGTLVAFGTSTVTPNKLDNINLTLQSGADLPKLGFRGSVIAGVAGSTAGESVYIVGGGTYSGVPKAALTFYSESGGVESNDTDTIYFTGASTASIIGGKSGSGNLSLKPVGSEALNLSVLGYTNGNIDVVGSTGNDTLKIGQVLNTGLNVTLGAGSDSVEIGEVYDGRSLIINDVGGGDTITAKSIKGGATFITNGSGNNSINATVTSGASLKPKTIALQAADTATLSAREGTSLLNTSINKDGDLLLVSAGGRTKLNNATVYGKVSVRGSDYDDYFNVSYCPTSSDRITLTGGSGNDGYYFGDSTVNAVVTDFGLANSVGGAKSASLGADVIYVSSLSDTIGSIKYLNGNITVGDNVIIRGASGGDETVYAMIAKTGWSASSANVYRIGANGASLVGGAVNYTTVVGSSGNGQTTFDLGSVSGAAYVNATGNSLIRGAKTYNGSNDSVATVINTSGSPGNLTQTINSGGNLILVNAGGSRVTVEGFNGGSALKIGTTDSSDVVVFGGLLQTTVASGLGEADYYIGASGGNTEFDFSNTTKKVIDLSGEDDGDKATYIYVKGVTGSSAGGSLLVSGTDAVTLKAAGEDDTLVGASKNASTLVSASGKRTHFVLKKGNGANVVQGFTFGKAKSSDNILINTDISYDETIVSASNGKVKIGEGDSSLNLSASGQDTVAMQYNYGSTNPGVAYVDISENGVAMDFNNDYNIIVGQGTKTTLVAGAGDTAKANNDAMPSGIGWNSAYLVSNVGTVDASASDMTAVNGAKHSSDVVKAATGSDLDLVWVCGGIGAGFADSGDDTLVASGKGHDEIFVGAKMGNDVVQNLASNDKLTFIDTKISDYGGDINKILTINDKSDNFSAVFSSGGSTTTIKGTVVSTMSATTNLTFHFDDVDYVWDGSKLEQA